MRRTNERTARRSSDEDCPLGRHQAVGRELGPGWDSPGRVAERERSRAEMRAGQRGYQLRNCGRRPVLPRRRSLP